MSDTFKTINPADIASTRTLLHEAIPVTGTIISGTYADNNIKTFAHGMFQSVYDYPYLSSSANHIFDLTAGFSTAAISLSSSTTVQVAKKVNIYNQMAQVLVGFDETGSVRRFDRDGNLSAGTKHDVVFFVNFARLLSKDEIKKGSFQMTLLTGNIAQVVSTDLSASTPLTIYDADANRYLTNSPAGEYTLLHTSSDGGSVSTDVPVGLLYYQAGVAVITASVFNDGNNSSSVGYWGLGGGDTQISVSASFTGSTIDSICGGFRNRIKNIQFNNTTELNSTIYFCRANHTEFNYSSNPTYLSASTIRVKNVAADIPIAYATSVGLYSADHELLAVAKLSEPLRKDSNNEFTIRVRLDY